MPRIRSGRVQHTFGAFRFDPDMSWGNQPLTSNTQGGYYRAAFQNRRWIVDGGLDYVEPVSGNADSTVFATGYARYQWSSRTGIGGGIQRAAERKRCLVGIRFRRPRRTASASAGCRSTMPPTIYRSARS